MQEHVLILILSNFSSIKFVYLSGFDEYVFMRHCAVMRFDRWHNQYPKFVCSFNQLKKEDLQTHLLPDLISTKQPNRILNPVSSCQESTVWTVVTCSAGKEQISGQTSV